MTDVNALHEAIMEELNNLIFSDENKDEQEDFLFQEEEASDEIPRSLLSYFEASNNRAAACKKLLLEGLEGLTSSYTEDGMNLLIELEKDVTKLNETVVGETEDKEKNTSADCLVAAPTETEALFTDVVVVSSSNKAETAELTESSEKEEEMKENDECQREHREKRLCEEMKKEEQRTQREKNFQEELKKIMEAEKLHQMELELMENKAQEKLKQELLLQQELIRNLRKRVEEEMRMTEEEEKKRKREEEKIREMERMDAEMRKIKERCKEKERRNKEEELRNKGEEKIGVEKDAKKNQEEENKIEQEMIKGEVRKIKDIRATEGEERRTNENEDKINEREINAEREEESWERGDVTREKMDGNKQKIMLKEDCKKKEVEEKGREGEVMITKEPKKHEEMRKKEEKRTKVEKENDVERRHSVEDKDIRKEESKTKEEEEAYRQMEEKVNLGMDEKKVYGVENRKVEYEKKTNDKERKREEEKKKLEKDDIRKKEDGAINTETDKRQIKEVGESKEERRLIEEKECKKLIEQVTKKENLRTTNELQEKKRGNTTGQSLTSHPVDSITWTSSSPDLLPAETTANPISSENAQQQTSVYKTMDQQDTAVKPCTTPDGLPVCLPEHTEQKRLSWMKNCTSWSKLSLQNRRKQKICVQSRRMLRKAAEVSTLPPLCPVRLLLSTGCKSLQELTTVTLEDLPGCTLSSLVQCTQLQSLTLRRCGLKSLEGLNQLSELCYVDVQENDISSVACEDMTSLRVLRLGHNKLTSIHGLSGADCLDVLELSHNSITRIAGLESMRRLQRLSVDHNQLICTKGLRDVYTLLYLNCSHNHLVNVEGIENSPLLNTLDLRANSLTEPPSLNNHVLLRELHLDDNCISSLQCLTASWLPLMQHLSAAQNRIAKLPCMSDFVSLANLDLQFNCISELQNLCESLKGCKFLQDVYLTGNPLQQESGWRSTLEKALPGLRAIDNQVMDFLSAPPVQQVRLSSVTFLIFCQTQLQQTCELQQQLSRELSNASSSLDAVKDLCRHFTEILKLAEDQRFAHEYGNITVFPSQVMQKKSVAMDSINAEMFIKHSEMEATDKGLTVGYRNNNGCSYWTFEESSTENWCDPLGAVAKTDHHSLATKEMTSSSDFEMVAVSNYQDLDLKSTAAVMIQQWWRKCRQKCGIIRSPLSSERERGRRSDGEKPELEPSYLNGSFVSQHRAATVIQLIEMWEPEHPVLNMWRPGELKSWSGRTCVAEHFHKLVDHNVLILQALWRGFTLRRRLASALTAVTCLGTKEDDTFEDVDMDEFVFDGTALEQWTLQLPGDSPSRCASEVPLSPKPPGVFHGPPQDSLPPAVVWRPKQAWGAGEHLGSAWQSDSSEASNRSKSPALESQLSGLSERSEKILEEWGFTNSHTARLMLKRAQKMKSKKEQQKKHKDPLFRLALFRNCNYQLNPVETRSRPAPHNRKDLKVCKANLGDKTEQVKQERTRQWLNTESDRDSESEHFLPEISSDILNGGRVQLVADPGRHHPSGLWANSSLAVQPCRQNSYLRRNSLSHARKEALSPKRVASAPSKKERISFRDNPVQLSGGWGGGRKRDKVHKS